jgi:hypothetical protein
MRKRFLHKLHAKKQYRLSYFKRLHKVKKKFPYLLISKYLKFFFKRKKKLLNKRRQVGFTKKLVRVKKYKRHLC